MVAPCSGKRHFSLGVKCDAAQKHERRYMNKVSKNSKLIFASLLVIALPVSAHENPWSFEFGVGHSIGTGELLHAGSNSLGAPRYDVNNALVRSITLGYEFHNGLRLELDVRTRDIDVGGQASMLSRQQTRPALEQYQTNGEVQSVTRMFNLVYVGELGSPDWTAYTKVGLGDAANKAAATVDIQPTFTAQDQEPLRYLRHTDHALAGSLGFGVIRHINERTSLGLDYQYSFLGDAQTERLDDGSYLEMDKLAVHEVSIKLRYIF